jgi:acetoin utilization deacetylase AcuC-like enzyme
MIHDVAVAIRRLQRDDKVSLAMTLDCDVHHGNGTAAIFAGAPWIPKQSGMTIIWRV